MTRPADPIIRRVRCPHCGSCMSRVYSNRPPTEDGSRIQYRRCLRCELTFKTILEPAEARLPADRPPPGRSRKAPRI